MGHHFMNGDVDLSSNNQAEAGANNLNGEGGEWSEQDPMDCGESPVLPSYKLICADS